MSERPRFRRTAAPADDGRRLVAMAVLLLVCVGLLGARAWVQRQTPPAPAQVVVEVQGQVPQPGYHAVAAPARVHAAVAAAGGDPAGMVDATVEPGTRIVVEGRAWRAEPMDELLVVGVPVDVNAASAAALQAVPGIGPARAEAIVAERAAGGPYATVDDLDRVHGIGPATVEALRPFVVAEPP